MKLAIDTGDKIDLRLDRSHWLKSCPKCSQEAGIPVFKLYPDAFGESDARGEHHHGAQSWCLDCRAKYR